jgi:hypothetical protein
MAGRSRAKNAVLRSTLLFTPFLAITLFGLAFIVKEIATDGATGGRIVGLVLVALVALLLGYQVVQSLRDLLSQTVETIGEVERSWTRNDFFLFRNSYVFLDRDVYRVPPQQFLELSTGDKVRIVHLPHTGAVETIERIDSDGDTDA